MQRSKLLILVFVLMLASAGASGQTDKAVLVGFHAAPGLLEEQLITTLGGRITHRYKYIPVVAAVVAEGAIATLLANAAVAYVEDDRPLVPLGGKRQTTDYGVAKIEAPGAWALGYRGDGIKVGIFDSGIDVEHPDLANAIAGGIDLVGDGHGLDDCNGHGTHVAGIVGSRDNGRGTVGVAPRVRLYSMRFADCLWEGATTSKEIMGIEWAIDNGMHVVNMSFGAVVPLPNLAEEAAMNAAYQRGIVLVAASGNSSTPAVGYPASYEAVIAVGATDEQDQLATFSQWGTAQELTAPGVANLSAVPVGFGQTTDLTVDSDGGRALDAIGLEFAGVTSKKGLTATAVYAGLGTAIDFAAIDCAGAIALMTRGGTSFAEKTIEAQNAGCAGAIIHNNQPGNFNGTLSAAGDWIPVVSISLEEGLYLKDQIHTRDTTVTLLNVQGDYAMFSGTSMASPHAAGVAALVLQRNPGASPDLVRQILAESSEDLGLAGWDPQFGYGRVNARRAVER